MFHTINYLSAFNWLIVVLHEWPEENKKNYESGNIDRQPNSTDVVEKGRQGKMNVDEANEKITNLFPAATKRKMFPTFRE